MAERTAGDKSSLPYIRNRRRAVRRRNNNVERVSVSLILDCVLAGYRFLVVVIQLVQGHGYARQDVEYVATDTLVVPGTQ